MQNDLYQRGARKQSRTPRSESNVTIHGIISRKA